MSIGQQPVPPRKSVVPGPRHGERHPGFFFAVLQRQEGYHRGGEPKRRSISPGVPRPRVGPVAPPCTRTTRGTGRRSPPSSLRDCLRADYGKALVVRTPAIDTMSRPSFSLSEGMVLVGLAALAMAICRANLPFGLAIAPGLALMADRALRLHRVRAMSGPVSWSSALEIWTGSALIAGMTVMLIWVEVFVSLFLSIVVLSAPPLHLSAGGDPGGTPDRDRRPRDDRRVGPGHPAHVLAQFRPRVTTTGRGPNRRWHCLARSFTLGPRREPGDTRATVPGALSGCDRMA